MDNDEFLLRQGEAIVSALEQRGYVANQLANKLQWQVTQPDDDWWLLLTFLPRPVAQWRLLPAAHNNNQAVIYSIIEQTIGGRR